MYNKYGTFDLNPKSQVSVDYPNVSLKSDIFGLWANFETAAANDLEYYK